MSNPSDSGCKNIVIKTPPNVHHESRYQHLAGPGCTFEGGYNGHRIGVREMRGMNCARYILKKPRGALSEDGDEGEEKLSQYFVSAVTTSPPDAFTPTRLEYVRYGVSQVIGRNYPSPGCQDDEECAIPVHDACWKIFEKVSIRKSGRVDLEGFAALWWREPCRASGIQGLKHDSVIRELREKWWIHRRGTEYLAANPVDIPGFKLMMQEAYTEVPKGDGVFLVKDSCKRSSSLEAPYCGYEDEVDPFMTLPSELKSKVLVQLSSKDVSSLRLASRAFKQLPKRFFRQLILDETPWFWEVDQVKSEIEEYYQATFQENYGNDLEMFSEGIPPAWLSFVNERMQRKPMDTNWHQVYKQLKTMERGTLGLRNRVRIWKIAEDVISKIKEMRCRLEAGQTEFRVFPPELAQIMGHIQKQDVL